MLHVYLLFGSFSWSVYFVLYFLFMFSSLETPTYITSTSSIIFPFADAMIQEPNAWTESHDAHGLAIHYLLMDKPLNIHYGKGVLIGHD